MPILGAHMSIAGGYFKAVIAAAKSGCDCVQLFTKNNNQWRAKEITDDDSEKFAAQLEADSISHPISHASYLINMASPDDELWLKSIQAMKVELQRADQLGIPSVIVHPGSFTTSSEEAGLARIGDAMNKLHEEMPNLKAKTLLENTAGQGTNLGWKLPHLSAILDQVQDQQRVGVCIDTCHAFAAGYDFSTPSKYKSTISELEGTVGLDKVLAFHLNDSKKPLGSRVDRHEHIGRGDMGDEPFRQLLNDSKFAEIPMYLETPKKQLNGEDADVVNLRHLRSLVVQ